MGEAILEAMSAKPAVTHLYAILPKSAYEDSKSANEALRLGTDDKGQLCGFGDRDKSWKEVLDYANLHYRGAKAEDEFVVLEVMVEKLQDCNLAPHRDEGWWSCSALPLDAVEHVDQAVRGAGADGQLQFLEVVRSSKCPFPFIYLHDPAQGWRQ